MLRLTLGHPVKSIATGRNRAAYFRIQALYEYCPKVPEASPARDSRSLRAFFVVAVPNP